MRTACLSLLISVVFILCAENLRADNLGIAAYGLLSPHWDCDGFFAVTSKAKVLRFAVLYNTFGNDSRCLDRIKADPRPKEIELILLNEPCQRNKRCGEYELLAAMDVRTYAKKLAHRDPEFLRSLEAYFVKARDLLPRNATCYVSPGLESNLTNADAQQTLLAETRKIFPDCKTVWNPLKQSDLPDGADLREGHTDTSPYTSAPCIVNLDGQDLAEVDLEHYVQKYQKCQLNFLWSFEMNGNMRNGPFVDPSSRTNFNFQRASPKIIGVIAPSS